MLAKLASRKLWVTILIAVAKVVLPAVGIEVPWEVVAGGLGYVLAEGAKDAAEALRKK